MTNGEVFTEAVKAYEREVKEMEVLLHVNARSTISFFSQSSNVPRLMVRRGSGGGGGLGVVTPPARVFEFFSTNFLTIAKKKKKNARNILWTLCTLI